MYSAEQAALLMNKGNVIAYPTEAVWGLGCDPFNQQAVYELLSLKNRSVDKGLILVADDCLQLRPYIEAELLLKLEKAIFDRPTTWLMPYLANALPSWVTGQHDTVAVRVSQHPTIKTLTQAFGGPIISTSANPAGCLAAREIFQVRRYFGLQLPLCRGRISGEARPSQIIDALTSKTLRQ